MSGYPLYFEAFVLIPFKSSPILFDNQKTTDTITVFGNVLLTVTKNNACSCTTEKNTNFSIVPFS